MSVLGSSSTARVRDAALLTGFVLSLVGVVVTPFCTRDRVRAPQPWVAFVQANASALTPGATLLVHPPWRDDVVDALRAAGLAPTGGAVTATLAPRHGDALPPLWIVKEAGGVALPRNLRAATLRAEGEGLELWALESRRAGAARDLTDDLMQATVSVTHERGVTACSWDPAQRRHVCPDLPEWMYVGAEALPIGGASERCAWAHPITNGTVSVVFPASVARAPLLLELALTDTAADNRTGAAVTATLRVDGREVGRVVRRGTRGFAQAKVAALPPGAEQVSVELTTDNDGQRHTCFRLTSGGAP